MLWARKLKGGNEETGIVDELNQRNRPQRQTSTYNYVLVCTPAVPFRIGSHTANHWVGIATINLQNVMDG